MATLFHQRHTTTGSPAQTRTAENRAGEEAERHEGFVRRNALSLACLVLFLAFWGGQSVTGWLAFNEDQREHGDEAKGYIAYLATGHFGEATFENWESEFLQMGAFVLLTAFLVQRGSGESKDPDNPDDDDHVVEDSPRAAKAGGALRKIYENSLALAFIILFLLAFAAHAWAGMKEFNSEAASHGEPTVGIGAFLTSAQFWFQSLQNWQSEFLAVFAMVVLSIFLRQKSSPESKPVAAPHSATGT